MEWLAKQREAKFRRAPSLAVAEGNKPTHDKGKRKVVDSTKTDQSCKFKVDPLVLKAYLEIEAKRKKQNKRIAQRLREKQMMEEKEKEF